MQSPRRWLPFLLLAIVVGVLLLRPVRRTEDAAPRPPDRQVAWPTQPAPTAPAAAGADTSRQQLPPAQEPATLSLRVLVVASGTEAPIPDASVYSRTGNAESWALLGVTDAKGMFEATLPPVTGGELLARAPGWRRQAVSWTASDLEAGTDVQPRTIRIELLPGGRIEGLVRFLDGTPAGEGLRVLAWPAGREPAAAALAAAVRGDPSVPWTLSDAEGRFTVDGLEAGLRYQLAAGGSAGVFSPKPTSPQVPGGEPVVVEVAQLFGARLVHREKGGRPLRLHPRLRYRGAPGVAGSLDPTVEILGFSREKRLASLTGLPADLFANIYDRDDWTLHVLAYSPGPRARAGPLQFYAKLPGYKPPPPFRIWLLPVTDRLPVHEIELEPMAAGWGSMEVSFLLPREQVWPRPGDRAYAELILQEEDGRKLSVWLDGIPADGHLRLDGIPWGVYAVRFKVGGSLGFQWPPHRTPGIPVTVGSAPARVELDLREMGGLLLDVRGPDGQPWTGGVMADLSLIDVRDTGNASLAGPPYGVRGLPSTGYRVEVWPWGFGYAARSAPVEVFVPPGGWGRATVELPRLTDG